MEYLKKSDKDGFKNLFLVSSASFLALFTLIFVSAKWSLVILLIGLPVAMIIYERNKASICFCLARQGLSNESAHELAVAYFYAQGLVIGVVLGWVFGHTIFG